MKRPKGKYVDGQTFLLEPFSLYGLKLRWINVMKLIIYN